MTWKNRKRLAMVRIQLRKTLKYLLHVGFTKKNVVRDSVRRSFFFSLPPGSRTPRVQNPDRRTIPAVGNS